MKVSHVSVLFALVLAGLLAVEPVKSQSAGAPDDCAGAKPLSLAEKDVVAAPRSDRLLALINFAAVLPSIPLAEQTCAVTATARKIAAERMAAPQARRFQKMEIILAIVDNMDEYARPNYAGMRRLGRMTFERNEGGLAVVEQSLRLEP